MPRIATKNSDLFNEDVLSWFDHAIPIEAFVKNFDGFEGEGDIFSKFGLEIRDQITFTISVRRFKQVLQEKVNTESAYNFLLESANTSDPDSYSSILMESGGDDTEGYDYTAYTRPREGDLVFFPQTGKVFEIRHVQHEEKFYQLGRLYTYDLSCELFEYSHERFDTEVEDIDNIETSFTMDQLQHRLQLESGDYLMTEADGYFIVEEFNLDKDEYQPANNTLFEASSKEVIDFSETNPFST